MSSNFLHYIVQSSNTAKSINIQVEFNVNYNNNKLKYQFLNRNN